MGPERVSQTVDMTRIDANYLAFLRSRGCHITEVKGGYLIRHDWIPHVLHNCAWVKSDATDESIHNLIETAAPARFPIVLLTQLISPRVSGYLKDNKYAADSEQSILVYLGKPMPTPKPDVKINRITDLADIQTFVNVRRRPIDYVQMYKSAIDGGGTRLYLAKIDNVPVGAALTFFADGVATLHDLDVLPAFRNKGVGTDLLVYRIRELVDEKCGLIWTNPNRGSLAEGIMIRLGMKPMEHMTLFKKKAPLYKRLAKRMRNL